MRGRSYIFLGLHRKSESATVRFFSWDLLIQFLKTSRYKPNKHFSLKHEYNYFSFTTIIALEIETLSQSRKFVMHLLHLQAKKYRFLASQSHASCAQQEIRAQLDTLSSLYPPSLSHSREGCRWTDWTIPARGWFFTQEKQRTPTGKLKIYFVHYYFPDWSLYWWILHKMIYFK